MAKTTGTEDQASPERSPSPETPHPRTTQAPPRGIKFPISELGHIVLGASNLDDTNNGHAEYFLNCLGWILKDLYTKEKPRR